MEEVNSLIKIGNYYFVTEVRFQIKDLMQVCNKKCFPKEILSEIP